MTYDTWQPWFAWFPVPTSGGWTWLRKVERMKVDPMVCEMTLYRVP